MRLGHRPASSITSLFLSGILFSSIAGLFSNSPVTYERRAGVFSFLEDLFSPAPSQPINEGPAGTYVPPPRIGPGAVVYRPASTPSPEMMGSDENVVEVEFNDDEQVDKHTVCRVVLNKSPTEKNIFVPTQSAEEWAAFREGDRSSLAQRVKPLPAGVTLAPCAPPVSPAPPAVAGSCGPQLSEAMIAAALGFDMQAQLTPLPPRAGNRPRINATPATMNAICNQMGCNNYVWRAARGWSSPSDNSLVDWNGTAYFKQPGNREYGGVHLASNNGLILQCGPPLAPPPPPVAPVVPVSPPPVGP